MLYITQLIYVSKGQEAVFQEFESFALPILENYGAKLLSRIRPTNEAFIGGEFPKPYEIHFISFPDEAHLQAFMADEERKQYVQLKEQSIQSVILVKGEKM